MSPNNVRKTLDERELEKLTDSIYFSKGPLDPVLINQNNEVIAGGRRYLAAKRANVEEIWAIQKYYPNKKEEIYDSFIENITRDVLTERDRGLAVLALREEGETIDNINQRTGIPPTSLRGMQIPVSLPKYLKETSEKEAVTPKEKEEQQMAKEAIKVLEDDTVAKKMRKLRAAAARFFGNDLHGLLKFTKWMETETYDNIEQRLKELRAGMKINYDSEEKRKKLPLKQVTKFEHYIPMPLWNGIVKRCREDEKDIHPVTERLWDKWRKRIIDD